MPPAGPAVTAPIQVTPEDFHSVASEIGNAVVQLVDIAGRLHASTSAANGIGGVDDGAKQFDKGYQQALSTLFQTFDRAGDVLTDVSFGIDVSGYNHWNADAKSTPGHETSPPWSLVSGLYLPQNRQATTLVGNPVMTLPAPLDAKIPLGHQTILHELADQFTNAATSVNGLRNNVFNHLLELFANNSSADLDAVNTYWNTIGGSSDKAILTALENGCQQLAQAVSGFAGWIADTQNEIVDEIINFTGQLAKNTALSLIPALLASLVTDGVGGLPELVQVIQKVGEFGELVALVEAIDVAAAARLASGILIVATNANTAMSAAMSSTPNPNVEPTNPQAAAPSQPSDEQAVQAAENVADSAGSDAQQVALQNQADAAAAKLPQPVPDGWTYRVADSGKGVVFQRPDAVGNADMIRVMDPTTRYPSGYTRIYNSYGQPVDVYGKPGPQSATHIPIGYDGPWPWWPEGGG